MYNTEGDRRAQPDRTMLGKATLEPSIISTKAQGGVSLGFEGAQSIDERDYVGALGEWRKPFALRDR